MVLHFIAYNHTYDQLKQASFVKIMASLYTNKYVLVMVRGCICDDGSLFTLIKLIDFDGYSFITINNKYWSFNEDTYTYIVCKYTLFNYFVCEIEYEH